MDFFRGGEGINTLRSSLRSSLVTLNVRRRGPGQPQALRWALGQGLPWGVVGTRWAGCPGLGSPRVLVPLTKLGSRTVISLTSRKLKLL